MTKTADSPAERCAKRLRAADRLVVTGHLNPDGDSIGSAIALARMLRSAGKKVLVWNRDDTPAVYLPLTSGEDLRVGGDPPADLEQSFDLAVALECPSLDRSGLSEHLSRLPVVNIDHHLGNEMYGEVAWVDPEAPALGEMVLELALSAGFEIDAETATALFVALASDTGGFRFANATPRAFEAAAALTRAGADPTLVARWLYESRPEPSIRLLGEMLPSLRLEAGGRIASTLLTRSMFAASGATAAHTEGLIDVPRAIDRVVAVALVRELDAGKCKVSLRSRGDLDVESIARALGGGGHRNAAGYVAWGDPEAVRSEAVRLLSEDLARA
jgi:phosphoesterase RecJ-like protein